MKMSGLISVWNCGGKAHLISELRPFNHLVAKAGGLNSIGPTGVSGHRAYLVKRDAVFAVLRMALKVNASLKCFSDPARKQSPSAIRTTFSILFPGS